MSPVEKQHDAHLPSKVVVVPLALVVERRYRQPVRWTVVLLVTLATLSPSCRHASSNRSECSDPLSDGYYFPPGSVGLPAGSFNDNFLRHWFSETLRFLSEPSLSCRAPPTETCRSMITDVPSA